MYEVALEILNILENKGYNSYIVGGFVRDKLLNINSSDIDIITSAKPYEICNIFNKDIIDNYGSIKLLYKNFKFDITTFRKEDKYINNRWPKKVKYINNLKKDLKRRDFTINTICIDKNGKYIDLLNGINDLRNKVIVPVGNSKKKLKDDSLRILRAIRFATIYDFKLDKKLEKSIEYNKKYLDNLSTDRIKKELNLIFNSNNCSYGINLINKFNIFDILKIKHNSNIIITYNYISMWAQLIYPDNYNFSTKESKMINQIKSIIKEGYIDEYILYKYDINCLIEASKILKINKDINNEYNSLKIHKNEDIYISYDDIKKLSLNVDIKEIYIDLQKQILYNRLSNKKENIINYITNKYKVGDKIE